MESNFMVTECCADRLRSQKDRARRILGHSAGRDAPEISALETPIRYGKAQLPRLWTQNMALLNMSTQTLPNRWPKADMLRISFESLSTNLWFLDNRSSSMRWGRRCSLVELDGSDVGNAPHSASRPPGWCVLHHLTVMTLLEWIGVWWAKI